MKKKIVLALLTAASAAMMLVPPVAASGSYTLWVEPCHYPVKKWFLCVPGGTEYCPINQCQIPV